MSKTSKRGGPLDRFFTRRQDADLSTSSSQTRQSSQLTGALSASQSSRNRNNNPGPRQNQEIVSVLSHSHTSVSSGTLAISDATMNPSRKLTDAVDLDSRRTTKTATKSLAPFHEYSLRRSRSPSNQYLGSYQPQLKKQIIDKLRSPRSPSRRKKKFESDSDAEPLDSVIYVSKPSARLPIPSVPLVPTRVPSLSPKGSLTYTSHDAKVPPRKKIRLSSPAAITVPSSQSDEFELASPRDAGRHPSEVKEIIDQWRQAAITSSPELPSGIYDTNPNAYMDIDIEITPHSSTPQLTSSASPISVDEPRSILSRPVTPHLLPTPLHSTNLGLPMTPIALNAESKTAQIIAQIKANAIAASLSSSDEELPQFKDDLDDSSDEDLNMSFKPLSNADLKKGTEHSYKRGIQNGQPIALSDRGGRYNLRDLLTSSPLSSVGSSSPGFTRRTRLPHISTRGIVKKRVKRASENPLEKLLKEKNLADKRGKGMAAFQAAEAVVTGKYRMQSEMEDEASDRSSQEGPNSWADKDAVPPPTVCERRRLTMKSSGSFVYPSEARNDEVVLDEEDRKRLFGTKRGDAIASILKSDYATKLVDTSKKILGIPLWLWETDLVQCPDVTGISFGDVAGDPVLRLLKKSMEQNDFPKVVLLLNSGIIDTLEASKTARIIPSLCELALSVCETPLGAPSFRVVSHLWINHRPIETTISFPLVLRSLVRMGASPAVLNDMGWKPESGVYKGPITTEQRAVLLYRLVILLKLSASGAAFSHQEIPDLLMVLLLVAIDPSTSNELKREAMVAVDTVCHSIAPGNEVVAKTESLICTKFVKFASSLTPVNKAYCVSFLIGGSGRTTRIARWVSRAIILQHDSVTAEEYCELPSLLSLLVPLSPALNPDTPGIFDLHEKTDYEDMGFYIELLSSCLSDIDSYVDEERRSSKVKGASTSDPTTSPSKQKAETPLELVRGYLENLHSRIIDTRAANLDRSRTKAALKRLSMRVFYQRQAALRSGRGSRVPKVISQYFSPGRKL